MYESLKPKYVRRRELVDALMQRPTQPEEAEWIDVAERTIRGDLSEPRFGEDVREMGFYLALGQDVGVDTADASVRAAAHYFGFEPEFHTIAGRLTVRRGPPWSHN